MSKSKIENDSSLGLILFSFLVIVGIISVIGYFGLQELNKPRTQSDYDSYIKKMTRTCYKNSNSYKCYKLQFNTPIMDTIRNKDAISKKKQQIKELQEYKKVFDYCVRKNNTSLVDSKCLSSFLLFKDDIENKTLSEKISKYILDNPYKTKEILKSAFVY